MQVQKKKHQKHFSVLGPDLTFKCDDCAINWEKQSRFYPVVVGLGKPSILAVLKVTAWCYNFIFIHLYTAIFRTLYRYFTEKCNKLM